MEMSNIDGPFSGHEDEQTGFVIVNQWHHSQVIQRIHCFLANNIDIDYPMLGLLYLHILPGWRLYYGVLLTSPVALGFDAFTWIGKSCSEVKRAEVGDYRWWYGGIFKTTAVVCGDDAGGGKAEQ